LQIGGQQAAVVRTARSSVVVRAAAAAGTLTRKSVPVELEEGPMPMNTFNNKAPFKGKIKSVERIVGPKATGETCNIVIETEGKIPFWEGQSYGVIPPVSALGVASMLITKHLAIELGLGRP
jgi:ferredoxin--NADP+ reductase